MSDRLELPGLPQIELWPMSRMLPYARNSRTHSPAQVDQIKASMLEFGVTWAALADEQGIVAGHGRTLAIDALHREGKPVRFVNGTEIPKGYMPVVNCAGWNSEQRRAYIIADNQLALNAGWDKELLSSEVVELQAVDFNLSLLGFDDDTLAELLAPAELEPERDPEACPEPQEQPISKEGDMWVLGAHRLMCGDATVLTNWEALMQGERANIVWTDPPYNVAYEGKLAGSIKNDSMDEGKFRQFMLDLYKALWMVMEPGAPIYVAHADKAAHHFREAFEQTGFKFSSMVIWRKHQMAFGRSDFQSIHEPIIYGWKTGAAHRWHGGRKEISVQEWGDHDFVTRQPDGSYAIAVGGHVIRVEGSAVIEESPPSIIQHNSPFRSKSHPTMKPVGLIEKMLKFSARPRDIVVDCCGGSGSTLMAADRMGMCARIMEIDPRFADVTIRRWQNYTGRRAVNAATGEEFPDLPDPGAAQA